MTDVSVETTAGFDPDDAEDVPAPTVAEAAVRAVERLEVGTSPDLRADDAWSEAGRKVLRFHLSRLLARVPGVLAGKDPEEVHAMRVAARRMRAAWRVFGDGFEREPRRRYQGELRDIGALLGAVRDLDVLIANLGSYGAARSARRRAALLPLLGAWDAERSASHATLVAALEAPGFTVLMNDYETLALTTGLAVVPATPHAPNTLRNRMPATLWDAYQAVWAFEGDLATADLATLHELRIAAKWFRYTLEFVREPLDPDAAALIRPVVALQDHLGDLHDLHVAAELARRFAGSSTTTAGESKAMARFVVDLELDVDRLGRTLDRTWRPVADAAYRRALGRAVSRL